VARIRARDKEEEIHVMFRKQQMTAKARRFSAVVAALALAAALSGCVVYPAGGYYHHPYWHEHYWR
jgi:hypothetical protein